MKQKITMLALLLVTAMSMSAQRFNGNWKGRVVDDEKNNTVEVFFGADQTLKAIVTISQEEEGVTVKFILDMVGRYESDGTNFTFYINRERSTSSYDISELINTMRAYGTPEEKIADLQQQIDTMVGSMVKQLLDEIPDDLQLLIEENTGDKMIVKSTNGDTTIELFLVQ